MKPTSTTNLVTGPQARERNGANVQSLDRACDLLECIADAGEIGLSELVVETKLPSPTIHRILKTLVRRGYAHQNGDRRYALGPNLIRLGELSGHMLGSWVRPFLTELVAATGETANLAVLHGDTAINVGQVLSGRGMRMYTETGRHLQLHCTSVGKVLLAQLTSAQIDEIMSRTGMESQTARTIRDIGKLHEEIVEIRKQGFAIDDGEQEDGVRCFAVPVPGGPIRSAMTVAGPASRLTHEMTTALIPKMLDIAAAFAKSIENCESR